MEKILNLLLTLMKSPLAMTFTILILFMIFLFTKNSKSKNGSLIMIFVLLITGAIEIYFYYDDVFYRLYQEYVLYGNIALYIIFTISSIIIFSKNSIVFEHINYALEKNVGDVKVYLVTNKHGRILEYNEEFYNLFESHKPVKNIKSILIDDDNYTYKKFLKFFKSEIKDFELSIELVNETCKKIKLSKIAVLNKNNKIVGYVIKDYYCENDYANSEVVKKENYKLLNITSSALAFYNRTKDSYILTSQLRELIGTNEIELSSYQLRDYIYQDDLKAFINKRIATEIGDIYSYRFNTVSTAVWVEEKVVMIEEKEYRVIYRSTTSPYGFKPYAYEDFTREINKGYLEKKEFGVIFICCSNVTDLETKNPNNPQEAILVAYFNILAEELRIKPLRIYRISNIEYGIIIEKAIDFEMIVRSINHQATSLLEAKFSIGNTKYTVKNKLGVVYSSAIQTGNYEDLIKAGMTAVDITLDKEYGKDYSIYQKKKTQEKVYDFKDYDIDLSDEAVNKYLKDIK